MMKYLSQIALHVATWLGSITLSSAVRPFLDMPGIPLGSFTLSSALAIIPWTCTLVYFGSLARSMADIFNGQAMPGGASAYLLFIISGLMLVVLVAFATIISRYAQRAC